MTEPDPTTDPALTDPGVTGAGPADPGPAPVPSVKDSAPGFALRPDPPRRTDPVPSLPGPTTLAAPPGPAGRTAPAGRAGLFGPDPRLPDPSPAFMPARRLDLDEDRVARVALTLLAEPGNRTVWTMVQSAGAPATLRQLVTGRIPDSSLRAAVIARAAAGDPRRLAQVALRRGQRMGARLVVPSDPEWPTTVDLLATLELDSARQINRNARPPLCLWARGATPLDEALNRSVAIIGSRAATDYGLHVTTDLAFGLAEHGWTVVSGGAFGIDAAAHRAALSAGGTTVAVLACGVDRPYPVGNSALFEQIADRGLLISEWPPSSEPLRHRFLIRNRVIAAATRGTVMVEAAARSGAGQTMGRVIALNRSAMVVPGPVTSAMSVGCHELLRNVPQALLVTGLAHVLDEVGRIGEHPADPPRGPEHQRDALDEDTALVLEAIPRRGTTDPETVAARAGLGVRDVLRRLSLLELAGLVVRRDGAIALAPAANRTSRRPDGTPGPGRTPPAGTVA